MNSTLKKPNSEELSHISSLLDIIKKRAKSRLIPFDEYMRIALYEPRLGYYSSANSKIGESGDFITAPEISSLFSYTFARQFMRILQDLESKKILEFGAGRGRFAADCISYLLQNKFDLDKYYIIEVSATLKLEQQEYLKKMVPDFYDNIIWLSEIPITGFNGVVFANEVLDAMPVSIFKKENKQIKEVFVSLYKDKLHFKTGVVQNKKLLHAVNMIEEEVGSLPDGFMSEVNLWAKPWVNALYHSLGAGAVFICDYGYNRFDYYSRRHSAGTIQCYYKHMVHDDPLIYTGIQDITAHVDFTDIAMAADDIGFVIEGYTTQGQFLLANGISEIYESYFANQDDQALKIKQVQGLKKLVMPEEMGDMFKVLCISKNINDKKIASFDRVDLTHKL